MMTDNRNVCLEDNKTFNSFYIYFLHADLYTVGYAGADQYIQTFLGPPNNSVRHPAFVRLFIVIMVLREILQRRSFSEGG
jgi:hypothetical protein